MTQNTQVRKTDDSPVYDDTDFVQQTEDETARLREKLEVERDARLRLAAEYQNYRRRTEQEKATRLKWQTRT